MKHVFHLVSRIIYTYTHKYTHLHTSCSLLFFSYSFSNLKILKCLRISFFLFLLFPHSVPCDLMQYNCMHMQMISRFIYLIRTLFFILLQTFICHPTVHIPLDSKYTQYQLCTSLSLNLLSNWHHHSPTFIHCVNKYIKIHS